MLTSIIIIIDVLYVSDLEYSHACVVVAGDRVGICHRGDQKTHPQGPDFSILVGYLKYTKALPLHPVKSVKDAQIPTYARGGGGGGGGAG